MCVRISKQQKQEFERYLLHEERSPATVKKYLHDVGLLERFLEGREASKENVLLWKEEISAQYAVASVNSMLAAVNRFLEFTGSAQCRVKPLKTQATVFRPECRDLTREDYIKLLIEAEKKTNRRLYLMMQCICATGIRISELRYITLEAVICGRAEIRGKGKHRTILLPVRLCAMLKEYAQQNRIRSGAVFVTRNGRPVDRSNVWKEMKRLCGAADVVADKVYPHNLRHLFAQTFYQMQKDIVRLADVLGHSSINTTRIYTIDSGQEHQRQLDQMNLLIG